MKKQAMKGIVKINGVLYKHSELHYVEGVIDIPINNEECIFEYMNSYARIWLDRFDNPVIAEPFAPGEDFKNESDRWYYNREVDFYIDEIFNEYFD